MGILTVVFALCHRSQQSGCKTERPSLCHPEVNDVIANLSFVDKVYINTFHITLAEEEGGWIIHRVRIIHRYGTVD